MLKSIQTGSAKIIQTNSTKKYTKLILNVFETDSAKIIGQDWNQGWVRYNSV